MGEKKVTENSMLIREAIEFAVKAHSFQLRKGTTIPYIVHPIEVMKIVDGLTDDEEVRAAAVLHDVKEDTGTTPAMLAGRFGERVAKLVCAESENKREDQPEKATWRLRKDETVRHLAEADRDVKIIGLGDKLANMRDIARDYHAKGDKLWERFNAPEDDKGIEGKKANVGWYYRSVAESLRSELGTTAAWEELDKLIKEVFETPKQS